MSSFSAEFIKRPVVDKDGELFGHLVDIEIDSKSGDITEILVELASDIDASKLIWPTEGRLCQVPSQEIERMGSSISLKR